MVAYQENAVPSLHSNSQFAWCRPARLINNYPIKDILDHACSTVPNADQGAGDHRPGLGKKLREVSIRRPEGTDTLVGQVY